MKNVMPIVKKVLIVLLAGIVLVAAGFGVYEFVKGHIEAQQSRVTEERVLQAVESAVKAHIPAHQTIKFAPKNECLISNEGDTWTVTGWAETTNAKGETTRTNYAVKLTYVGNDKFTLDSCNLF